MLKNVELDWVAIKRPIIVFPVEPSQFKRHYIYTYVRDQPKIEDINYNYNF